MARRVSETRKSSFTAAHQNKEMFKHEGHNSSKLFSQPHSLLHEQHEQKPTAKVSNQLHQTNILTSKTDQSRKWTHPSAAAAKTIAKKCYNYGFLLMLLLGGSLSSNDLVLLARLVCMFLFRTIHLFIVGYFPPTDTSSPSSFSP